MQPEPASKISRCPGSPMLKKYTLDREMAAPDFSRLSSVDSALTQPNASIAVIVVIFDKR